MHFQKFISTFYKKHREKSIAISLLLDSVSLVARLTVLKKQPKQKHGRLNKKTNKRGKY